MPRLAWRLFSHDTLDSTQLEAARRLSDAAFPVPSAIIARVQTAGRGRSGKAWHSGTPHGLWLTLVTSDPGSENAFHDVARASVAVALTLRALGAVAELKWPNDVLAGGRKIAGILAERKGTHLLTGIGVNLNQRTADFPEEAGRAASLFTVTGVRTDTDTVLSALLERYDRHADRDRLMADYRRLFGLVGRRMRLNGKAVRVDGVSDSGGLIYTAENGRTETTYSGSLEWDSD
jgi:BirA family biotin operon repressor/biotin-[acetyl-CoA-carboxylase] ligase